jgi:UDP-N-acetylmuramyl pentapeptide phosphotransferase/UDP-N-acetylglucosamine-1-phosphate transferase
VSILVGLVVGAVAGAVAWRASAALLARPLFQRTNFRGNPIITAGGVVAILAVVAVEALLTLTSVGEPEPSPRRLVLSATIAFGALGLLDDLRGDGSVSGFTGHLRSLARGEVTTGAVKLLGGGVVALALGWSIERSFAVAVLDGALIALVANVANLLDRAPGRTTKVTALVFAAFALGTGATELFATAVVVGAGLALLVPELRERVMLGDTGANVLGAALGVGIAVTASVPSKVAVTVIALGLNALSEVVSYSSLIERTPPLRAFDRLGRQP